MRRTRTGLIPGAIACGVILFVIIMAVSGILQLPPAPPGTGSGASIQSTKDNAVLGLAILVILGTFGIIAYYYRNIDFGSKK
ncbi:MAG: hypothetical protein A4E35_00381 [Methanoregula sp. PtaU1.Bin051]|nr:MAG: hypothetical protein A4E35_00381 [Methanoregula sp. PtaU1.Bin051]